MPLTFFEFTLKNNLITMDISFKNKTDFTFLYLRISYKNKDQSNTNLLTMLMTEIDQANS